uniref:Anaphase-promoting complex subunit 4 WD40 domain-containing protein n=1 Tax=Rhizochromulina marina TaxID=1034831 RepID=A0A7S2WWN2_9STRA
MVKIDGHGDQVVQLAWDPSSTSRLATVTGEKDKTMRVWDVRSPSKPAVQMPLDTEYLNMAWSPDGAYLGVTSANIDSHAAPNDKDYVTVLDIRKNKLQTMKFPYQVEEFCFSPNSRYLILTTEHGTLELHRFLGSSSSTAPVSSKSSSHVRSVQAHTGNCYCLRVDPANRYMAVGSKDSLISIWEMDDLLCRRCLGCHSTAVRSLSFSPCGGMLASASYDSVIDISEVSTGKQLHAMDVGCIVAQVAWQKREGSRLLAFVRDAKKESDRDRYAKKFIRIMAVPEPSSRR